MKDELMKSENFLLSAFPFSSLFLSIIEMEVQWISIQYKSSWRR
jgi:hypothetical protein